MIFPTTDLCRSYNFPIHPIHHRHSNRSRSIYPTHSNHSSLPTRPVYPDLSFCSFSLSYSPSSFSTCSSSSYCLPSLSCPELSSSFSSSSSYHSEVAPEATAPCHSYPDLHRHLIHLHLRLRHHSLVVYDASIDVCGKHHLLRGDYFVHHPHRHRERLKRSISPPRRGLLM